MGRAWQTRIAAGVVALPIPLLQSAYNKRDDRYQQPSVTSPISVQMLFRMRPLRAMVIVFAPVWLGACSTAQYYAQAVSGHLALMCAREPIERILADAETAPELRAKLQLALAAREFAVRELGLPDNSSYTSYADIGRRFLLWNVVATPEFSLTPKTWCMPIAGCVSYRGYYAQADAQALAARLQASGHDVAVGGVAAYSTLGWFEDPVVNTMLDWPDHALAGLIFHELSHQKVYIAGDSAFSEAFATAVEQLGTAQWLAARANPQEARAAAIRQSRRAQFVALVSLHRQRLEALYASTLSNPAKRIAKAKAFDALRQDYAELRESWDGYAAYDNWFAELSNAKLAALATYTELVPAFVARFEATRGNWAEFFAAIKTVAGSDVAARAAWLERWLPQAAVNQDAAAPG